LADEEHGIGISRIKEIIGMMPVTFVPQTPPYIKGVVNLRGKIIPVVELQIKFGIGEADYTEKTCIIIIGNQRRGYSSLMGILVDSVSEVLEVKRKDIEGTPDFGDRLNIDYISGIAK